MFSCRRPATVLAPAALALYFVASTPALTAQSSRGALYPGRSAITGVNIVPMTSDTVIRNAILLVEDGRIVALGPAARVGIPAGTRRIDGRGKYLIPGLADMHVHLYSDGETPDSVAPWELAVMVANGVTAVRLMAGTPEQLLLRRAVTAGKVLGPQLWLASPQFIGRKDVNARVVTTPEEARAAVAEVADAGYDFIKISLLVPPPVFDAIVAEAKIRGLPVAGHVDPRVGVARALAAGQHIEHLDNYMESVLADSAPSRVSVSDVGVFRPANWATIDYIDDRKVEQIAGATARAGVWVDPTLTLFRGFARQATEQELRARPDWRMIPPQDTGLYLPAHRRYWSSPPSEARRRRYTEVRNRIVKAIVDSGGRILAGSDTPEWFLMYGFTLHRELENLVAAGLTPYQALTAATRAPAEFLGGAGEWGTLQAGARADLVLLSANPLEDIRHTTRIEAVAVGGRWLERSELARMLDTAAARINPSR